MLLYQRHYAMVLRLDRRDRLDISELAAHNEGGWLLALSLLLIAAAVWPVRRRAA